VEEMDGEVLVVRECGRNAVLMIVVDALPWILAEQEGFLQEIAPFRGRLETVLGYSGAALPTLFSGKMPDEHGHWTMYYLDPHGSPFTPYKPLLNLARAAGREGLVRRLVERALPTSASIKGYFKLYDVPLDLLPRLSLSERGDIFAPGGLGATRTIFDEMSNRGLRHRTWAWRTPEEENFREAAEVVRSGDADVLFIYTPELDAAMHADGVFSARARAKLKEQERRVVELYKEAERRFDKVSLLVLSDHGMIDVTETHDLMGYLASEVDLGAPDDYVAFYDSTIARFWGNKQGALNPLAEALEGLDYGRILDRRELAELGLAFSDGAYGELIFTLEPGHIILPSFMGKETPAAMHGYHPEHPLCSAAFMSNLRPRTEPRHIRDMHAVMVDVLDATLG
jgi:hypothetical protein